LYAYSQKMPQGKNETKSAYLSRVNSKYGLSPYWDRHLHLFSKTVSEKSANVFYCTPLNGTKRCWYCGHFIQGVPYPMPTDFHNRGYYVVRGMYCTPNCVKAHIIEESDFYEGTRLQLLTDMLMDVYAFEGDLEVVQKVCFADYGGEITHDEYVELFAELPRVALRMGAPFVAARMEVERGIRTLELMNVTSRDHEELQQRLLQQQQQQQSNSNSLHNEQEHAAFFPLPGKDWSKNSSSLLGQFDEFVPGGESSVRALPDDPEAIGYLARLKQNAGKYIHPSPKQVFANTHEQEALISVGAVKATCLQYDQLQQRRQDVLEQQQHNSRMAMMMMKAEATTMDNNHNTDSNLEALLQAAHDNSLTSAVAGGKTGKHVSFASPASSSKKNKNSSSNRRSRQQKKQSTAAAEEAQPSVVGTTTSANGNSNSSANTTNSHSGSNNANSNVNAADNDVPSTSSNDSLSNFNTLVAGILGERGKQSSHQQQQQLQALQNKTKTPQSASQQRKRNGKRKTDAVSLTTPSNLLGLQHKVKSATTESNTLASSLPPVSTAVN
jgi:hypothetical protein